MFMWLHRKFSETALKSIGEAASKVNKEYPTYLYGLNFIFVFLLYIVYFVSVFGIGYL